MESNFAALCVAANFLKVFTFTLQDKAFFFNGAIYYSSLILTPYQPSITTFNFILCGKQIILTLSSFSGDRPASLAPSDEASLSKLTAGQVMNISLRPKKCSGQSRYGRYGSYATAVKCLPSQSLLWLD